MDEHSVPDNDQRADERMIEILRQPVADDVRRFLGGDDPDVEDVVQESLIAALRYLAGDVGTEQRAIKLAVTIGRNRCRDLLRRRRRWQLSDIDEAANQIRSPGISALDAVEHADLREHLLASLAGLSEDCRNLLLLRYMDNMSTRAICRHLGLRSPQAFFHRRAACLRRLRKIFVKRTSERP